jgi:hypothetical protein
MINLNIFGDYTARFKELLDTRVAIKRGKFDEARKMLDGRLAPYLQDEGSAKDLSYALKIVINIVYGLTSAKFDNAFRDPRNMDNIVAKRGALFMIDLKKYVQSRGFTVAHIKTDSIKIPNATPEIIQSVMEFGERYGYEFEHEDTYDKFCLVNDAVYIAKKGDKWTAVGAQFQHPYVYKSLFTGEKPTLNDMSETKQVTKGSIYMDFNDGQEMQFIGRIGRFLPVTPESGGGMLYRVADVDGEQKKYAVAGTKGFFWLEAEKAKGMAGVKIDYAYFNGLLDDAQKTIEKFGSFEEFVK